MLGPFANPLYREGGNENLCDLRQCCVKLAELANGLAQMDASLADAGGNPLEAVL